MGQGLTNPSTQGTIFFVVPITALRWQLRYNHTSNAAIESGGPDFAAADFTVIKER
jgi:hypothetical protein